MSIIRRAIAAVVAHRNGGSLETRFTLRVGLYDVGNCDNPTPGD